MVEHAAPARAETTATFWLSRLKEAHANLLTAIDDLAQLTRGPLPDKGLLVRVRWEVSKASLSRRLLWGQIHTCLAGRVEARFARDLRQLQETDISLIRASAKHVGRWSIDAIVHDWAGYCQASELMRSKMLDAIALEERLLYSLLESLETHSSLQDDRA